MQSPGNFDDIDAPGSRFLRPKASPTSNRQTNKQKKNPSQNKLIIFKNFKLKQRQPHINFTILHVLMTHLHAPMSWNRFGFRENNKNR